MSHKNKFAINVISDFRGRLDVVSTHLAGNMNCGVLKKAQMMTAHEIQRTTKLYDRTSDVVSLDEVERVVF